MKINFYYTLILFMPILIIAKELGNPQKESSIIDKYSRFLTKENEILQRRDYSSKHYKIDENTAVAIINSNPIFNKNEFGEYIPIEIKKEKLHYSPYRIRYDIENLQLYFSESGDECLINYNNIDLLEIKIDGINGHAGFFDHSVQNLSVGGGYELQWNIFHGGLSFNLKHPNNLNSNQQNNYMLNWLSPIINNHELNRINNNYNRISEYEINDYNSAIIRETRNKFLNEFNEEHYIAMFSLNFTNSNEEINSYASKTGEIYLWGDDGPYCYENITPMSLYNADKDYGCDWGSRIWIKYYLGSIPDEANIKDVDATVTMQYDGAISCNPDYEVHEVYSDPSNYSCGNTMWKSLRENAGTQYENNEGMCNYNGCSVTDDLGNSANSDIENALNSNFFYISYIAECSEDYHDGCIGGKDVAYLYGNGTSNEPYLTIEYELGNCNSNCCNCNPGDCTYPSGSCNCNGNPNNDYCDCNWNVEDSCGICGGSGPGYQCWDNEFVCHSSQCLDEPVCSLELAEIDDFNNPIAFNGGVYNFKIKNNGNKICSFNIQVEQDWINITETSGNINIGESKPISVTIDPNNSSSARNYEILIYPGQLEISVTQNAQPSSITVGNITITGETINSSGNEYQISGNVYIGHINNSEYSLLFPNGSFTANTFANTISPSTGISDMESACSDYFNFTLSNISFNTDSGSATVTGSLPLHSSIDLKIPFANKKINLLSNIFSLSSVNFSPLDDIIPIGFPSFDTEINLCESEFIMNMEVGNCINLKNVIGLDTYNNAEWTFNLDEYSIEIGLDLDILQIGLYNSENCIDLEKFVFSPIPYGPQIHIKWDIDDKRIEFTDDTAISIPIPFLGRELTDQELEYLKNENRYYVNANGNEFISLGIKIKKDSFIDLGVDGNNCRFHFDSEVSALIDDTDFTIELILGSDNCVCDLNGLLGLNTSFSTWVTIDSDAGFNFDFCEKLYSLEGGIELDLFSFDLENINAKIGYSHGDKSHLFGSLVESGTIADRYHNSGVTFEIYSDHLILNGFHLPFFGRTQDTINYALTIHNADKQIYGIFKNDIDLSSITDLNAGSIVFDQPTFTVDTLENSYKFYDNLNGIDIGWKINSEFSTIKILEKNKVGISSNADKIRIELPEDNSAFVEVSDTSKIIEKLDDYQITVKNSDEETKVIIIRWDESLNRSETYGFNSTHIFDSNKELKLTTLQSNLSSTRSGALIAEYPHNGISSGEYDLELNGSINNLKSSTESVSSDWLQSFTQEETYTFYSINSYWNNDYDTIFVEVIHSEPSKSSLEYGEGGYSIFNTIYNDDYLINQKFGIAEFEKDWQYKIQSENENGGIINSGWKPFPPPRAPIVGFDIINPDGCSPHEVKFENTSEGGLSEITKYYWEFGNGVSSNLRDPSLTYYNPGVYSITLTVYTQYDTVSLSRDNAINIFNLEAEMDNFPSCINIDQQVRFVDNTEDIYGEYPQWEWDFDGNGSIDATGPGEHVVAFPDSGLYISEMKLKTTCATSFDTAHIKVKLPIFDCNGNCNVDLDRCDVCNGNGCYLQNCDVYPIDSYDCNGYLLSLHEGFIPDHYSISKIHPNPFNPISHIQFALPEASNVKVDIYDLAGREAVQLTNQYFSPGYHSVQWNAEGFPSGLYFVHLNASSITNQNIFQQTEKLMLLK